MKADLITKAVRFALVAGATTVLAAPAVYAQDAAQGNNQNQNQNANTAQLGKIEVTGTRIKRTSVETAQPVTVITSQQIRQSGLTSVGDVLASISSVYSTTNLQVNNGGNGSNQINLRQLGTQRVLVLVNGKRWVPNLGNGVDLNTIPAAIIDHVEILQDGASAIYGSDAIAGVVNIITVKNYNGAEANAYLGIYHGNGHSDGKVQEYDYTVGASNDKSGVVFNVAYTNQDGILAGDRSISKEPLAGTGQVAGSSGTPAGRFIVAGPVLPGDYTLNPGSFPISNPAGNGGANFFSNTHPFGLADRYNFAPLNYLLTPTETTSLYLQGHYDLADNLTFTSTALYNNRNSQIQLAAEPFFIGGAGAYAINGQTTAPQAHIGIDKTNPYNPFGVTLTGNSQSACIAANACDALILLGRRMVEQGPRVQNYDQDTFFWSGGLNGYFTALGNEWDWDAGASYGRQDSTTIHLGSDNIQNVANALGPAFLPAGAANVPGNFECGTPSNPITGCVPLNLFGGAGSITPAMTNYIVAPLHDITQSNQRDYTANITGTPFNLPAGPFGLALGAEYLENDGTFLPDNLSTTGNSSNGNSADTAGRETTRAEYVEFNIPLLSDLFLAKDVSLDVANRWSQFRWEGGNSGTAQSQVLHSTSANTGRAALRWQTNDELLLRASWSQGFRLPSVSEFFSGQISNFLPTSDPCAVTAQGGGLGATSPIPKFCPPTTTNTVGRIQPNAQILNITGGNPSMTPERSISKTAGFVYSPDWAPGFDFSADYYDITIVNTISAIGGQNIINNCFFANTDCAQIAPNPNIPGNNSVNKPILSILNLNTNIGTTKTSGIDISTHYKLPSTAVGDFRLGLDTSFVKIYDVTVQEDADPDTGQVIPSGFATSQLAGWAVGGPGNFAVPRRRASGTLTWNYGAWSANYQLQFVGSMLESCSKNPSPAKFPTLCSNPAGGASGTAVYPGTAFLLNTEDPQGFHTNSKGTNHIGAGTWTNVEATYHLDAWNTDFTFGIRNLWDKDPPISIAAFANSYLGGLYPVPGRFFYARVGVKF